MTKIVEITGDSPYGEYHEGDRALLEGFVRGGNDVPCAVVSLKDGQFVCAPVYYLRRTNDVTL